MVKERTTNTIDIEPGDIIRNRYNHMDNWVVMREGQSRLNFAKLPDDYEIPIGMVVHDAGPGDWFHCEMLPDQYWMLKREGPRAMVFVPLFQNYEASYESPVEPCEPEKMNSESCQQARVDLEKAITEYSAAVNNSETHTDTVNATETVNATNIYKIFPREESKKTFNIEDFCVPKNENDEHFISFVSKMNEGVSLDELVDTLKLMAQNCKAFLRIEQMGMYHLKSGEMKYYFDEIFRMCRELLEKMGVECKDFDSENESKSKGPLLKRFPMLDFDASDCAKILIKRINDVANVSWLNRLNDILCQIKNRAENGDRGLYYDGLPFSHFAWAHGQLCTNEVKELRYLMRELELRGFTVKVLSVPKREEECEDSNICLGIEW